MSRELDTPRLKTQGPIHSRPSRRHIQWQALLAEGRLKVSSICGTGGIRTVFGQGVSGRCWYTGPHSLRPLYLLWV